MRRSELVYDWLARACALPLILAPVSNPDLFWHLNAARRMLAEGRIPRDEAFSYTRLGTPWVDFEWLFQLVVLGAETAAGPAGLWALKAALWAAAAALVEAAGRASGGAARGRLLLIFWCAASLGRAELKPELFSVVFFLAFWVLLELQEREGSAVPPAGAAAAGSSLLFALWANLHGGWALGLALLGIYAALGPRAARPARIAALAAGAAATFLNPYGWRVWAVMMEHARFASVMAARILEWGPLSPLNPFHVPQILLLAAAAASSVVAMRAGRLPRRPLAALAVVLGAAGASHSRLMAFAAPAAGLLLVEGLEGSRWTLRTGALGAAVFVGAYGWGWAARFKTQDLSLYPVSAGDFIAREREVFRRRRVYNEWGWGGYIARRFGDDIRVFMDGRYLFHPLLAESAAAERTPEDWAVFLDRWSVDWVLIRDLPSADRYFAPRDWALIHRDGTARVYVRRAAFPAPWLSRLVAL
ncbi:MAG: hypothetical protein HY928_15365 [Elusimicrobia bacterium]|nr:hypothetical protein [Elusimicrobiota bacterium]